MKILGYTLLQIAFAFLIAFRLSAQPPDRMSYQMIVRNNSNELVVNQQVSVQISILQDSASGQIVYSEQFNPTTNSNGLITLEIGHGVDFATIDWSSGPYFIKTETDPSGGSDDSIINTTQILSVPYAQHASTANNLTGEIEESDPMFTQWDRTTGISITESQIEDFNQYLLNIKGQSIGELSNVDATGATEGSVLRFDVNEGMWIISELQGITEESDPIFLSTPVSNISWENIQTWDNKQDKFVAIDRGEILYWHESRWVNLIGGEQEQTLHFCYGTPQWGPCEEPRYNLTVIANPPSGGSVTGGAGGLKEGDVRTVIATSNEGYQFTGWSGDALQHIAQTVEDSIVYVTIPDNNLTLTANFAFIPLDDSVHNVYIGASSGKTIAAITTDVLPYFLIAQNDQSPNDLHNNHVYEIVYEGDRRYLLYMCPSSWYSGTLRFKAPNSAFDHSFTKITETYYYNDINYSVYVSAIRIQAPIIIEILQ